MSMIEINFKPGRKQLRAFGLIGAAITTALACWVFWRGSFFGFEISASASRTTSYVLWCSAGLLLAMSVVFPKLLHPVYVGLTVVTLPIGFVMSYVVMGIVFFGVFTPIALVFRLIGRDSLNRKIEPEAETYWVPRQDVKDVGRYFRQF